MVGNFLSSILIDVVKLDKYGACMIFKMHKNSRDDYEIAKVVLCNQS